MTGAYLYTAMRRLLRDDARGASTDSRYYSDDEIGRALMRARADAIKSLFGVSALLGQSPNLELYYRSLIGRTFPLRRPRMTIAGLFKSIAFAGSPQTVPGDFWRAECGQIATGSKYVKTNPAYPGEMMSGIWEKQFWVKGGKFYGTLCNIFYWADPQVTIDNTATDLESDANGYPLTDRFYHAIKYKAMTYLLKKERADHLLRIDLCERIYGERLGLMR